MYNETTRLVRVIEVPLVADENEDVLVEAELGGGQKGGATKEPVRGESDDQQTGVTYKLSDTAENLWIAYEVVAEFTDENGRTHYSPLAKKALADMSKGGNNLTYSFVFDSGDTFECENADDYPTLVDTEGSGASLKMTGTVPYGAGGGGTGGGVLVVTETVSGLDSTLSATYKQIADAGFCVRDVEVDVGIHSLSSLKTYGHKEGLGYAIAFLGDDGKKAYIAETENDYPVYHDDK